mgnify:CR=1 FL=1
MNILVLVPRVAQRFIQQFPETVYNAYKYFNYDNRVVEESVPRGDIKSNYKTPDELTDMDYDGLVHYAKTLVNPTLVKYSTRIACEDALHSAIRSYNNGMFDGKVNAGRYEVLLKNMMGVRQAKKKKKEDKKAPKVIPHHIMKRLDMKVKDFPVKERVRKRKGQPEMYKQRGRVVIDKTAADVNQYLKPFLDMVTQLPTKDMDVVRQMSARWPKVKKMINEILQQAAKDSDKEYVDAVKDDFEKAAKMMDRLRDSYENSKKFDMESIKTYFEPLQNLISEADQQEPAVTETPAEEATPSEEAPAEEESLEMEEETAKS